MGKRDKEVLFFGGFLHMKQNTRQASSLMMLLCRDSTLCETSVLEQHCLGS